jgi:hypothetical protein
VFDAYRFKFGERRRFEHLVYGLFFETDPKIVEATFSLVNMLVNLPESLADRLALRSEFRALGVEEAIRRLEDTEEMEYAI